MLVLWFSNIEAFRNVPKLCRRCDKNISRKCTTLCWMHCPQAVCVTGVLLSMVRPNWTSTYVSAELQCWYCCIWCHILRSVPALHTEYSLLLPQSAVLKMAAVYVVVGTNLRHTTCQKNEGLSYPYADAWNLAWKLDFPSQNWYPSTWSHGVNTRPRSMNPFRH